MYGTQVAFHLDGLLELRSTLARDLVATNPVALDRLFKTAAGFLEEGALEARWGAVEGPGGGQVRGQCT